MNRLIIIAIFFVSIPISMSADTLSLVVGETKMVTGEVAERYTYYLGKDGKRVLHGERIVPIPTERSILLVQVYEHGILKNQIFRATALENDQDVVPDKILRNETPKGSVDRLPP